MLEVIVSMGYVSHQNPGMYGTMACTVCSSEVVKTDFFGGHIIDGFPQKPYF